MHAKDTNKTMKLSINYYDHTNYYIMYNRFVQSLGVSDEARTQTQRSRGNTLLHNFMHFFINNFFFFTGTLVCNFI